MSGIVPQVIESFGHAPSGIEHPIEGGLALAVTGVAMYLENARFKKTEEKTAVQFPNAALLEQTVGQDQKQIRRSRLGSAMLEYVGVGLAAASLLANPTYDTSHVNNDAKVMFVEGKAFSMTKTEDLGQPGITRDAAVKRGLKASNYNGQLGIIEAAATSKVVLPLTSSWRSHLNVLNQQQVDPNGNETVPALQLAESLLPPGPKAGTKEGTVVVATDSVVDDSPTEIAAQVRTMTQEGISVRFVVPGTGAGTYRVSKYDKLTSAAANAGNFAGVSATKVEQPQTVAQVEKTVASAIHDSGIDQHKNNWLVVFGIGSVIAVAGFVKDKWQRATRKGL